MKTVYPSIIEVGEFTYGHEDIVVKDWLQEKGAIRIGSYCSIAPGCIIHMGGNHAYQDSLTSFPFRFKGRHPGWEAKPFDRTEVTIGHDVWIGTGVSIRSGVTIGTGAIIASYSHVIKDVKPYEIHGGNPAKFIKSRFGEESVKRLLESKWWEHHPISEVVPYLCQDNVSMLLNFIESKKGVQ
jgi:acetyltransferase-like isoleucine patch superfamily enzyme